jgi:hypothetical protein
LLVHATILTLISVRSARFFLVSQN